MHVQTWSTFLLVNLKPFLLPFRGLACTTGSNLFKLVRTCPSRPSLASRCSQSPSCRRAPDHHRLTSSSKRQRCPTHRVVHAVGVVGTSRTMNFEKQPKENGPEDDAVLSPTTTTVPALTSNERYGAHRTRQTSWLMPSFCLLCQWASKLIFYNQSSSTSLWLFIIPKIIFIVFIAGFRFQ